MNIGIPIQEFAARLAVPPHHVRRWIARGYLIARRGKGGRIFVNPRSFDQLLRGGRYAEDRFA